MVFLLSPVIPKTAQKIYDAMTCQWVERNRGIFRITTKTLLQTELPPDLSLAKHYLVISNHQSWADILILFYVLSGKIPMLKFFMKKELKWVPIIGQVCWIYGFPFLNRQGGGKDIPTTKKACTRFKQRPGSLMIFPEGTRFTALKHEQQQSPYSHLLKPKTGGISIALETLDDKITSILDVSIIYTGPHTFWDYCRGNIKNIKVIVREIPLKSHPADLQNIKQFINQIWHEKNNLCKLDI